MATWMHCTADPDAFYESGIQATATERADDFRAEGLFVYRAPATAEARRAIAEMWNREYVLIECDRRYVTLVQRNPLGTGRALDEYMIPVQHFAHAEVLD